jgi:sugar lactone lactonase YvrE
MVLLRIGFAACAIGIATTKSATAADALTARKLEREALAAYAEKDRATFLSKMQAAVALRPDHPRWLFHLAAAHAVNGEAENAIATLARIADLGVSWRVPREEEFDPLWDREDFQRVLARLDANQTRAIGVAEVALTLTEMNGLIEGIAWHETAGEFFFGDVRERCVWRRAADGSITKFTTDDARILGVFGLAIDEPRRALWAATSAVPEMRGYATDQRGTAGVAEFDLASGAVRRVLLVPADAREHVLGDIEVAPDGAVFATDSSSPALWRLSAGGDALEAFMQHDEFLSLQGIAFTADGRGLWLTAYGNGLLHLDLETRSVRRLKIPPATTLLGCDGIERAADGSLFIVQNGGTPTRLLRVRTTPDLAAVDEVRVLLAAQPAVTDATLGCFAGGDFVFIAEGGWSRYGADAPAAAPRSVPVLRVRLD